MDFSLASGWYRKRVKAEVRLSGRPVQVHRITNPYYAASIEAGPHSVQNQLTCSGRHYLSKDAPSIPLPTCDARNYGCRYRHRDDGRDGLDRRRRAVWYRSAGLTGSGNVPAVTVGE